MRVTNVIREKIDMTLDKKLNKKIAELYAERKAYESKVQAELNAIRCEADEKARAVLAKYPNVSFSRWGERNINFVQGAACVMFDKDEELDRKAAELREKKKELAMDLEIRCSLEKNADDFFKMLAEASL